MISRGLFLETWKRMCRRFGRVFDEGNLADAEDYLAFLGPRMDDQEFGEAAPLIAEGSLSPDRLG